MAIQLHLFDVAHNKAAEVEELDEVSPFALFKILLDEQNPFYGVKGKGSSKGCNVNVPDLRRYLFSMLKFAVHFLLVMGVLYLSAIVFAYLEHPNINNDVCDEGSRIEPEGTPVDQVRSFLDNDLLFCYEDENKV